MTDHDYRRALESATREYEELGAKRREIDQRLAQLAHSIGTLTKLTKTENGKLAAEARR